MIGAMTVQFSPPEPDELLTRIDSNAVSLLDSLPATDHGRILTQVVDMKRAAELADLLTRPKVDNEDLSRDFRYKLGFVQALFWVLSLPEMSHVLLRAGAAKGG